MVLTRRRFLAGLFGVTALSGSAAYASVYEPDDLQVKRTDVALPHWPCEANGVTIGLLSDFHGDDEHAIARVERSVNLLLAERPDIVYVAGDYVSMHLGTDVLQSTIDRLVPLTKAPRGAFAILGNHDWRSEHPQVVIAYLKKAGFTMMSNVSLPFPGVPGAYLVGLDDPWCGQMDLVKALRGVPENAPKMVAVHEPDFADWIGPGFDLQLSGHSHGGQVRIPGLPVIYAPPFGRKYPQGLLRAKNHLVYTTRGVGMVGIPIRTFCPPEVTLLTLRV